MKLYLVGGAVRDKLLGLSAKDLDYCVEMPELVGQPADVGFVAMQTWLMDEGFDIFLETPEFLTIRARFPRGHRNERMTGDFVLCREDGPSSDGRRPDFVRVGTLHADLSRRDFTMNAMAEAEDGTIIDPHGGREDLAHEHIRFVGDPMTRLREDGLRALRAIRFAVTKGFNLDPSVVSALMEAETHELLRGVSAERIREELHKAFKFNTPHALELLTTLGFVRELFSDGLWLEPTLKA